MDQIGIETNLLNQLHYELTNLPVLFRDRVCEECSFSVPTFYRKLRSKSRVLQGKRIPPLSNAERAKIREIGIGISDYLNDFISRI